MKEVRHNVQQFSLYSLDIKYALQERLNNIARDGFEVISVSITDVRRGEEFLFSSITVISRKEYEI